MKTESKTLQLNALMLINAMTKATWRNHTKRTVQELNSSHFKEAVFNNVLQNSNKANDKIAHELYVWQTYSLR